MLSLALRRRTNSSPAAGAEEPTNPGNPSCPRGRVRHLVRPPPAVTPDGDRVVRPLEEGEVARDEIDPPLAGEVPGGDRCVIATPALQRMALEPPRGNLFQKKHGVLIWLSEKELAGEEADGHDVQVAVPV